MTAAAAPASRRLRVLVVAASTHPDRGSEPGLGWGWVEALAAHHDLWVITGEREGNREAIERRLLEVPEVAAHVRVYFIPRPDGPRLERVWPFLYYRRYRHWHARAFELASRLASEVRFDIAHQLNMTGYREPGYLWRMELPFVWGPVGGTANVPLRFAAILGAGPACYHLAKTVVNSAQLRFHPRVRRALSRAAGFVTSNSTEHRAFLEAWDKHSHVIADTGPPRADCPTPVARRAGGTFRIAWSGIHVSRKALPLVLKAVARLPPTLDWHLDIVGDGPMSERWKALAATLGVDARCTWHGWLPTPAARGIVGRADVLAFLSLHEGTPTVVMEALAMGVPVVCLDLCGQGDIVDDSCGIKIAPTSVRASVDACASALLALAGDPRELARLSAGAARRSRTYDWAAKASAMNAVYRGALGR